MNNDLEETATGKSARRRRRFPLLLAVWVLLIYGTSCTVVRPQEFFDLVQRYTAADRESMQRFAVYWGLSWFVVVKGWHVIEFVILTCLTVGAIGWWRGSVNTRTIIVSMMLCITFAASDEWHQTFIPDRFGTFQDVLIDSLGVLTAGVVLLRRSGREHRKEATPASEFTARK